MDDDMNKPGMGGGDMGGGMNPTKPEEEKDDMPESNDMGDAAMDDEGENN